MKDIKSSPPNPLFFVINLLLCIIGTLTILWFAFGVEQQHSKAQILFDWMLQRSTFIIIGLVVLMILILAGSYIGMKWLKDSQLKDANSK